MLSALTIAALLWAPGVVWSAWLCPPAREPTTLSMYVISTAVLATGLLTALLFSWALLELGWFGPVSLTGGLTALTGLGAGIGWRYRHNALRTTVKQSIMPFLLFLIASVLLVAYAPRSEWLAGGWDPGVYMNQGIFAAQHGGWQADPMLVHMALAGQDFNPFARPIAGRDELFPGIPMDPASGTIRLTFYPLTPSWIALLYLIGGLHTALLAMPLLALILLFVLPGALLRAGAPPPLAYGTTVLTFLQPLILYHARTPCSEMLETALIGMLLLAIPQKKDRPPILFCSLLLLAGILNRPTFLIWVALLFPLLASTGRLRLVDGFILSFPVLLGAAYYLTRGQAALDRITDIFPLLAGATVVSLYLSTVSAPLLRRVTWKHFPALLFLLAPVLILLVMIHLHPHPLPELRNNIGKLIPYIGWPLILLSVLGILLRLLRIRRSDGLGRLDCWLLFCLCAAVVPLVFKFVAELYPWATKRYLSSMSFALALSAATAIHAMTQVFRARWPHLTVVPWIVALLVLAGWQGSRLSQAWLNTEYDGLSVALAELAIAIPHEDIVLADHFLWATPLTLIHSRQTLNGEPLWARESEYRTSAALGFLREQQKRGRRVFVLTGTEYGMEVFPEAFHDAQPFQEFPPYTYHTIAHHRNGTGFPLRERTATFRLYLLMSNP